MSRSRSWCLASLLVLAGCVNAADNTNARCLNDEPCPAGQRCYGGFCIPNDAGSGLDANVDANADAGPIPDAGCPRAGEECMTGMNGECARGRLECNSRGLYVCIRMAPPGAEACNGLDDDCDTRTDEGADSACTAGGCTDVAGVITCQGVCAPGILRCEMGVPSTMCVGAVAPAGSDGCTAAGSVAVDDDCDGDIDQDCTCADGATVACYTGSADTAGIGACTLGTATCSGTGFGECVGAVGPRPETCANPRSDDDCNGVLDDVPGTGVPCDTGGMGVCADGVMACNGAMEIACDGPSPVAVEACDTADDDCDGNIDEAFDLTSDEANCGECGHACSDGQTCCDSACVSTNADDSNCGACGTTCEGANVCCQGMCRPPTAAECTGCPTDCSTMGGQTCCEDEQLCVDGMTDSAHCGATEGTCGVVCGMGQRCCGGVCAADSDATCGSCGTMCSSTQQCCGAALSGACVADLDPQNCLSCGRRCASGESCCAAGVGGEGAGCRNFQNDELNCGACGNRCASGQTCSNGVCCTGAQVGCGGECVNLQNDGENCGTCGRSCSAIGICCRGGCTALACL